jgi:hypothetical protein
MELLSSLFSAVFSLEELSLEALKEARGKAYITFITDAGGELCLTTICFFFST